MTRETIHNPPDDTAADPGRPASHPAGVPHPFPADYRPPPPPPHAPFPHDSPRRGACPVAAVRRAQHLPPPTRLVAPKFPPVGRPPERRQQALEVLRNEARILGSVRHPNIVQVHAWREAGYPPFPCLVLQLV